MSKWIYEVCETSSGLTDVPGFYLSGIGADIRKKQNSLLDLGIFYSPAACRAAGVFTRNRVRAAPVTFDEEVLGNEGPIHGIVANSGNANACTGEQGMTNTREMAKLAEELTSAPEGSFLVCSTGRIGRQLPMDNVREGIRKAVEAMGPEPQNGIDFADCILTSDTKNKKISVKVSDGDHTISISGVAKGAGMIRPDMATMLGFIATDLEIGNEALKSILLDVTDLSFNAITVDGDMSTNDTVLCLANGVSGLNWDEASEGFKDCFKQALLKVCEYLAYLIVGDGEKITKVVTLKITGAASLEEARKAAYAVAHSPLVKSSWAGSDPNWGRVIAAIGYSGVPITETQLKMDYDGVPVMRNGTPVDENLPRWQEIVAKKQFEIAVELGMGEVETRLIASDLTPEYITFNMKE